MFAAPGFHLLRFRAKRICRSARPRVLTTATTMGTKRRTAERSSTEAFGDRPDRDLRALTWRTAGDACRSPPAGSTRAPPPWLPRRRGTGLNQVAVGRGES